MGCGTRVCGAAPTLQEGIVVELVEMFKSGAVYVGKGFKVGDWGGPSKTGRWRGVGSPCFGPWHRYAWLAWQSASWVAPEAPGCLEFRALLSKKCQGVQVSRWSPAVCFVKPEPSPLLPSSHGCGVWGWRSRAAAVQKCQRKAQRAVTQGDDRIHLGVEAPGGRGLSAWPVSVDLALLQVRHPG